MDNNLNVGYGWFGRKTYIFVDTCENIGKRELAAARVDVNYRSEMVKEGCNCKLVICRVKAKSEEAFLSTLKNIRNKAILTGCNDYDDICAMLNACKNEVLHRKKTECIWRK